MKSLLSSAWSRLSGRGEAVEAVLPEQADAYLCNLYIARALKERTPFLASRLGFTESFCLTEASKPGGATQAIFDRIWRYSGVFPANAEQFRRFQDAYLSALSEVDLLGVMRDPYGAALVHQQRTPALICRLSSLEPYFCPEPWSQYLEGLRVCVIHPFVESIRRQYEERREELFFDPRVLPRFDLRMVKAPQNLAGNTDGFESWSQALAWLEDQVMSKDFDVAISGCGAYGLPLGGFIKRQGKICIHLGGAAQTLFGVSGAKWRAIPAFRVFLNKHWRPPLESERPPGFEKVEDGCYW